MVVTALQGSTHIGIGICTHQLGDDCEAELNSMALVRTASSPVRAVVPFQNLSDARGLHIFVQSCALPPRIYLDTSRKIQW